VRLVVEREREIRAFVPDEYWEISANFTADLAKAAGLAADWTKLLSKRDEKGNPPTLRQQGSWLAEHGGFHAELIEYAGEKFDLRLLGKDADSASADEAIAAKAVEVAQAAGLRNIKTD